MFPHVQSTETRAVDARGWYAGRAAADDAVLGSDRSAVADCASLRTPRCQGPPLICGHGPELRVCLAKAVTGR
jgi:hypothetical protein